MGRRVWVPTSGRRLLCVEPMAAGLSPKQQAFIAAYIGPARLNATEAARIAGYQGSANTLKSVGSENLAKPDIKAAIDEHLAELKKQGITLKQNRLDAYNDRWGRLNLVITDRAADPTVANMPGGKSGLIVKQLKKVHHRYEPNPDDEDGEPIAVTEEIWEAAVDTGMLKEMRDLEKQAAIEAGDWTEKSEVSNSGAVRLDLAGMRVPLPTAEVELE